MQGGTACFRHHDIGSKIEPRGKQKIEIENGFHIVTPPDGETNPIHPRQLHGDRGGRESLKRSPFHPTGRRHYVNTEATSSFKMHIKRENRSLLGARAQSPAREVREHGWGGGITKIICINR